jgi:hypothetical protein
VSNPPEPDGPPSNGSDGRGLPVARAGLVLVAFVVVTILLLGVIHPSAAKSASGSAASPAVGTTIPTAASSPSTTSPTHSTTPTTTVAPSKVSVLVANASGVTGAAASVTNELQPGGWNLASPVNASAKVATSSIYYLAGQQQSALAIASTLHLPSTVVGPYTTAAPISSIGTAEVLVVVGPDLATRATASTTTTAATTATTAARSSSTSSTSHH